MPQHLPPAQPAPDDPSDVSDTIVLRTPQLRDAAAMWRLAVASGALEANSAYAYLLCCAHFAGTSLVAVDGSDRADKPVDGDGFVGGEGSDALQQATTAGREPRRLFEFSMRLSIKRPQAPGAASDAPAGAPARASGARAS